MGLFGNSNEVARDVSLTGLGLVEASRLDEELLDKSAGWSSATPDELEQCIRRGARLNAVKGPTPHPALTLVATSGREADDVIARLKVLLRHKANPNIPNVYSERPLQVISGTDYIFGPDGGARDSKYRLPIAKFLIESGASVQAADKYGITPLHAAASAQRTELVELYLKSGASANATTKRKPRAWKEYGDFPETDVTAGMFEATPLHAIDWMRSFDNFAEIPRIARLLVTAGADASKRNALGETAAQLLRQSKEYYLREEYFRMRWSPERQHVEQALAEAESILLHG